MAADHHEGADQHQGADNHGGGADPGQGPGEPGRTSGSPEAEGPETATEGAGQRASGRSAWTGPLSDIQEAVTDIVDTALRGFGSVGAGRFPRYELVRVPEEGYRLLIDLPGVRKEDLEVTTTGDELTLRGRRRRPELPEGSEVLRSERGYGDFERSLRVPVDVDPADVRARLDDGVLTLTLPRRSDARRHKVEVES